MHQRLATQIREQMNLLVDQYDARLRLVPGYADLPQPARHDLERRVLQLIADCLDANDNRPLIQYIQDRAEQVLTHAFQPEWFQQAVIIPQDIISPLIETVGESDFVWRSLGQAQTTAWEIVARERRRIELTLRESEARYQTIFDATPIMFWLKDVHNRTLRINKAAATFEGVTPVDVEGKSAYDLYPREQAEAFYQDDLEVIRSNKPKLGIVEQHTSVGTGKLMWVETGKTPVHNDRGETVGVLAFGVDVTERKRVEEQVQESLVRRSIQVQTSTEVAQEIAAATDLNELFQRVVTLIKERFNFYHAQLFRYEPGQDAVVLVTGYGEVGQKMLEAGHKLQMGRGVVGTAAASGESILAADVAQDKDWRPNSNLPNTRGELAVPIKWRKQVLGILDVQSDQAGALTNDDRLLLEGLCGQIAIAMESKRLLDSVQQSEQLMRTLIDAVPAYIYAKDLQGRHLLGNAALAQLYGLNSPAELLGKTDFDFYARELAEQYQASELPILRDGASLIAHEEPNIGVDGRLRWNSTTKVPLCNALGQIIGLVGITSDITERKRVEQQMEETLRETERLYAAVSHDSWQAYRQTGSLRQGYVFDRAVIRPVESVWEPEIVQALDQRALVTSQSGQRPVAVTPLSVRGEVIGALGVYDDPAHPLGKKDLDLIEAVSEQVALALENARLFDQNQRDAEREHTLNRITSRVRSARSVDEVLAIAAQELRMATGASRSMIEIQPNQDQLARPGEGVRA